jgi:hypothetical protein
VDCVWKDAPNFNGLRFVKQVDRVANRLYVADGKDRVMALAVTPHGPRANNSGATLDVISFIGPDVDPFVGPQPHSNRTDMLALSPDRRWLLGTGKADGVVVRWAISPADGATGAAAARWLLDGMPVGLTIMPDSRHVAVLLASGDLWVYGFDAETGALDTRQAQRTLNVVDSGGRIINIGDIDNNGFEDYAVCPSTAGDAYPQVLTDVAIVLSDADGPLRVATERLVTCRGVTDIAAADFDGDLNVDLVISCWSPQFEFTLHQVYLRKGRGDGTFEQGADFVN